MKKITFLAIMLFATAFAFAQAPEKMSYQAVVRNSSGNLLQNQNVAVKVSVLQNSETGTVVYSERVTGTTNSNGLLSLVIGSGTVISGTFSTINWSIGNYYLKTEIDPTGGTNYTLSGTSQLLSVPYAMYAKSAGSATLPTITRNDFLVISPYEFHSDTNNSYVSYIKAYFPTNVTAGTLTAPIHLPNGATITEIIAYYLDSSTTKNYTFTVSKLGLGNVFANSLLTATTNTASTAISSTAMSVTTPITIDNANNFYYFSMSGDFLNNYDGISGVKIKYSYTVNS